MGHSLTSQRNVDAKSPVVQLLLLLLIAARAHITHAAAVVETATVAEAHIVESSSKADAAHQNTLADDIEHKEFLDGATNEAHSRQKRLIWITDDGRLALPPGTTLTFTPTIALPLVRHPPEGFFSNMSISFPVTIDFDKLGLTDNQNPLGDLPPIFARSFGHSAGQMLGSYVARYLHYKAKRDLDDQTERSPPASLRRTTREASRTNARFHVKQEQATAAHDKLPELPERFKHVFHGGERVMLYGVVEDFLSTFGMNGKACLLRTICEMHSRNLEHFGVFGEMTKLFLTVTKSPFSELMPEYVRAQEIGEGRQAPGECFPYYKECPKSIFKALQNHKYSEPQTGEYHEAEVEEILHTKLPHRKESDREHELATNQIEQRHDSTFSM